MPVHRSLFVKITKDFWNHELLPPELFTIHSINPNWYLSTFLLTVPQAFRDFFGKMVTINDWAGGGLLENRGLRIPDAKVGAKWSMHKFALAIDINVVGITQQEILDAVAKNRNKFPLVTSYEDLSFTSGWNHFDGRRTDSISLMKVAP